MGTRVRRWGAAGVLLTVVTWFGCSKTDEGCHTGKDCSSGEICARGEQECQTAPLSCTEYCNTFEKCPSLGSSAASCISQYCDLVFSDYSSSSLACRGAMDEEHYCLAALSCAQLEEEHASSGATYCTTERDARTSACSGGGSGGSGGSGTGGSAATGGVAGGGLDPLCDQPCPSGCCSIGKAICCQPPFCDGNCLGSPCCS